MNHQHYKEFCYLWSLSSLYDVFPNFQPPVSIHLRNFDLFLLYLEILRLNLRNFLKADASPRPPAKVHCLGLLLNPGSIDLEPEEVRIESLLQHELVSLKKKIILSYIAHTTSTKMLKMI